MAVRPEIDVNKALEDLERDGYTVFREVVDRAQLADFAADLDDAFERASASGELFAGGGSISGHLNCLPGERSRFIYDAVRDHGILDVVEALTPGRLDQLSGISNFNLPGSVAQHYHSDGLYTEEFLICNIAAVDTDLSNGAIDVLPGTHARFYKFWQYAVQRLYRRSTRLPLRQGDVLLRRSTMWHRGMPNLTDTPRAMVSFTFGELSAAPDDPFRDISGGITFSPNWYGTSKLSQLREKVFVRAPLLYSSYRFARSLVGNKGYSSW